EPLRRLAIGDAFDADDEHVPALRARVLEHKAPRPALVGERPIARYRQRVLGEALQTDLPAHAMRRAEAPHQHQIGGPPGGGLAHLAAHAFTRTYSPGASQMGSSLPSPGWRAGTFSGDCRVYQSIQCGHQEPLTSSALSIQSSSSPLGCPPRQYWYFPFSGGLMIPATCPAPPSTYSTGPPKSLAPRKTERAGAIWSSLAAIS